MSNLTEMNKIAESARNKSNNASLTDGFCEGEISGNKVTCRAIPVRTNGRCITQMVWHINGEKASKAKVAAL